METATEEATTEVTSGERQEEIEKEERRRKLIDLSFHNGPTIINATSDDYNFKLEMPLIGIAFILLFTFILRFPRH